MFNRQTGANLLIDEISIPSSNWSAAPRHISIALTNACDLSCSYCYAPKTRAELKLDTVIAWLHELDKNGTLGVGFGGGEPTIYPHFAKLCHYTERNTGLAVSFTTHGHHLTRNLLSSISGCVHFVRVSVDGLGNTYERLRKRSFISLTERIDALSAIVSFGINYVVNEDTVDELDRAVNYAVEMGATEFLLLPEVSLQGKGYSESSVIEKLMKFVSSYDQSVPLAISQVESDGFPVCNPSNEKGLRAFAHIDAEGIVKSTSYQAVGVEIGTTGVIDAIRKLNSMI